MNKVIKEVEMMAQSVIGNTKARELASPFCQAEVENNRHGALIKGKKGKEITHKILKSLHLVSGDIGPI